MKRFTGLICELFDNSKIILSSQVPFRSEVRELCEQNSCGCYGKSWTCPPAVGTLEGLQDQVSHFHQVAIFYKVYPLADSFDWEGMQSGAEDFQSRLLKLKKKIRNTDSDFPFLALGAGACKICETCTYEQQLPCRSPENAHVSVEAYGIDVMEMMKENGLSYNNGPNTVTYVGTLFTW